MRALSSTADLDIDFWILQQRNGRGSDDWTFRFDRVLQSIIAILLDFENLTTETGDKGAPLSEFKCVGYDWFRATCCQSAGRLYDDVLDLLKEGSLGRGGKRLFFGADGSGTLAGSGISAEASDLVYVQNLPRVPMGSWPGMRYTSIQSLQSYKMAALYL